MKTTNRGNQRGFAHIILIIIFAFLVVAIVFYTLNQKQKKTETVSKSESSSPSQFIQADFIDLSKIYSISKFRSGEGHDFSGEGETCRSMKHYFVPQIDTSIKPQKAADGRTIPPLPDGIHDIDIYSPVDGKITDISQERLPVGEQIYIEPTNAKAFKIRLFHIYKIDGIKIGGDVKAGQKIGVISGYSSTDVAIEGRQGQYISYFQVMPDSVFAPYQKRGATNRNDFIISKEYRDAHPIPCNQDKYGDQSFYYPNGYDHSADSFYLSGYIKPDYSKAQQGQRNLN